MEKLDKRKMLVKEIDAKLMMAKRIPRQSTIIDLILLLEELAMNEGYMKPSFEAELKSKRTKKSEKNDEVGNGVTN